jgi:hypothetical protein
MSYAAKEDVKALFRHFADNTEAAVTDTAIEDFLSSSTAYIDARLNGLYLLPITSGSAPESFKILKQINAFYVAAIVDDILNNYSQADKKPIWHKKAEEMLTNIAPEKDKSGKQNEPNNKLIDATYLGTNIQKGKFKANSTDSTTFKKGTDTW